MNKLYLVSSHLPSSPGGQVLEGPEAVAIRTINCHQLRIQHRLRHPACQPSTGLHLGLRVTKSGFRAP